MKHTNGEQPKKPLCERRAEGRATLHPSAPQFYTTQETCACLLVTPRTLATWREQGRISYLRINARTFRYPLADVLKQLAK